MPGRENHGFHGETYRRDRKNPTRVSRSPWGGGMNRFYRRGRCHSALLDWIERKVTDL